MSDIIERLKFLAADDVEALMKAELATIAQAIAKLSFHRAMLTSTVERSERPDAPEMLSERTHERSD